MDAYWVDRGVSLLEWYGALRFYVVIQHLEVDSICVIYCGALSIRVRKAVCINDAHQFRTVESDIVTLSSIAVLNQLI